MQNIRRAEALALEVWKAGAACICPHMNTALFGGACPDAVWLQGDLEILKRCDAATTVDGWHNSEGSRREVDCAIENGMLVFHEIAPLKEWLEGKGIHNANRH